MKIHNYTVFPSIITEVQCDVYQYIRNPLIEWIYNYQKTVEGVIKSNRGGWQSPPDFWQQESFCEFKDYILNNTFAAVQHYHRRFELVNMWININKKGDYNVSHTHPACILSGVFWIKTSEKCGELKFLSPNSFVEHLLINCVDKDVQREHNYDDTFNFSPQEGTIVLFPSHLEHLVEPNESDEDRISIAFNLS